MRRPFQLFLPALLLLSLSSATVAFVLAEGQQATSLTPPIRGVFLYPWFPEAWRQQGLDPFSHYTPAQGFYSSEDDAVIDEQLRLMQKANLQAAIASWFGPGSNGDRHLPHIMDRANQTAPSFYWAVYYEDEGYSNPSVDTLLADLNYLNTNYFQRPNYLRIGGQPVVFVYGGGETCEMPDRWRQAEGQFGPLFVVLKVLLGWRDCPSQPDSWHQYAPSTPVQTHLPHSVVISPGFWKANESSPRLVRDPARFRQHARDAWAANATWKLVTTWSEWGEGTSIEPASASDNPAIEPAFGETYINILCEEWTAAPAGCTGTPTATSTSTPVPPQDSDGDGWSDAAETYIGTDPQVACLPAGWPPDVNGTGSVGADDLFYAASRFGRSDSPRVEIASQDGLAGIDDVFGFGSRFTHTC